VNLKGRARTLLPALLAGAAMAFVAYVRMTSVTADPTVTGGVELYREPQTVAETLVVGIDGQSFGQIAYDVTMARPVEEFGSAPEAAYREARPIYAWIAFVLSGGGRSGSSIALALVFQSVLAVALLAHAAASLADRLGRVPLFGAAVALLPGAAITVYSPGGCEAFGCALGLYGVRWWIEGKRSWAIAIFCVAALTRETLLLFPAAVAITELQQRAPWRRIASLAAPFAAYGAWLLLVKVRIGALPSDAGNTRLSSPIDGVFSTVSGWSALTVGVVLSIVACAALALARLKEPVLRWLIALHVVLALTMGASVWDSFRNFSRVLLPLGVLGVVALCPKPSGGGQPVRPRRAAPAAAR
jgi:hypothetical protein